MKLLIVDDDLHIRRLIGIYLRDAGFEVTEAATGEEGLEIAQREPKLLHPRARSIVGRHQRLWRSASTIGIRDAFHAG